MNENKQKIDPRINKLNLISLSFYFLELIQVFQFIPMVWDKQPGIRHKGLPAMSMN